MFVWIDYGPENPQCGPWIGERVNGTWYCRTIDGRGWDAANTVPTGAKEIRYCEDQYDVQYIDEDHPRYGELCARAMRHALTEGTQP